MKILRDIKHDVKKVLPEVLDLRHSSVQKPDGSLVTRGDLLVDSTIASTIRAQYPDAIIVSEETATHDEIGCSDADDIKDIFVVDPIDGTENFTNGLPEWGVTVSRYSGDGKHVQSMLWCPELNLYIDTKSNKKSQGSKSRIAGISSSMRIEDLAKTTPGYEYRMFGCCVYSMIQVIRGNILSFENPRRANSWDILGGLNLALAAGLSVKVNGYDYIGEYLPHTEKYSFRIDNAKLLS